MDVQVPQAVHTAGEAWQIVRTLDRDEEGLSPGQQLQFLSALRDKQLQPAARQVIQQRIKGLQDYFRCGK